MRSLRERKRQFLALSVVLAMALAACGGGGSSDTTEGGGSATTEGSSSGELVTVGFAQTGSESGWRSANTESMKEAFSEDNGFELVFNAADNDPAAQIALRHRGTVDVKAAVRGNGDDGVFLRLRLLGAVIGDGQRQ